MCGLRHRHRGGESGTIVHAPRVATIYQARVPWCSVLVRKIFGVASAGHMNHARLHYSPSPGLCRSRAASKPYRGIGGIEGAGKLRSKSRSDGSAVPLRTAELLVGEIVDPRDTRLALLRLANPRRREAGPVARLPSGMIPEKWEPVFGKDHASEISNAAAAPPILTDRAR
jgi:propionyl-CoA carboxylase beta chain